MTAAAISTAEHTTGELSDAELISAVRGGDTAAYGPLFARHRDAATRLARTLLPGPDADDLVSEAFIKVLGVLQRGGGPDTAFRAYLLTSIRRLHIDRTRANSKVTPTDDFAGIEPGIPFVDTAVAGFEGGAAARAFRSLPERWQLVLWHLEVEGDKPIDIAPLLGMSPNSVSALAYRAREGLRQAFLQMHAADLTDDTCQWTHRHLAAYVRHGLAHRDTARVEAHLRDCRKCTAIYLELAEVNSSLAGILGPVVLGGAAAAYLSGAGGTSAAGLLSLARLRELVRTNTQGALAAGAAAVVGIAAVAAGVTAQQSSSSTTNSAESAPHRTDFFPHVSSRGFQPWDSSGPESTRRHHQAAKQHSSALAADGSGSATGTSSAATSVTHPGASTVLAPTTTYAPPPTVSQGPTNYTAPPHYAPPPTPSSSTSARGSSAQGSSGNTRKTHAPKDGTTNTGDSTGPVDLAVTSATEKPDGNSKTSKYTVTLTGSDANGKPAPIPQGTTLKVTFAAGADMSKVSGRGCSADPAPSPTASPSTTPGSDVVPGAAPAPAPTATCEVPAGSTPVKFNGPSSVDGQPTTITVRAPADHPDPNATNDTQAAAKN